MNNKLYNAVYNNHMKRAEELLKNAADPDYCRDGFTMLTLAAWNGNVKMCRLLMRHGANVDENDDGDSYPIHCAVYKNNMDVFLFLMEKGADVNVKDWNGETPLHIAIKRSYDNIVERLLASDKIDWEIKDNNGKSPLELADTEKKLAKFLEINKNKYEESLRICDVNKIKFKNISEKMRALKMGRICKEIEEKQTEIGKLDIEIKDLNEKLTQVQKQRNQFEEERIQLIKKQEDLQKENESFSWVKKDYECPVCLSVPYAPKKIVLCTNGHSLCIPCKKKLKVCPICKVDLGITVRNFLMEKLIDESGKKINS